MLKKFYLSLLLSVAALNVHAGKVEIINQSKYDLIVLFGPHHTENSYRVVSNGIWRTGKYNDYMKNGFVKEEDNKREGSTYITAGKSFKFETNDEAYTTRVSLYRLDSPINIVSNVVESTKPDTLTSTICSYVSYYIPYVNIIPYALKVKDYYDNKLGWAIETLNQKESQSNGLNQIIVKNHSSGKTIELEKKISNEEKNDEIKDENLIFESSGEEFEIIHFDQENKE
jgi:hypothetical protein